MFRMSRLTCMAKAPVQTAYQSYNVTSALPFISRSYAINRFYKTTNIIENSNSYYSILLDNRTLKTPFGKELVIRNKSLALAVAEEWNNQKEHIEIDPMHLTKLCFLAVDNDVCTKDEVIKQILSFLETDTVFFISDTDKDLEKLLTDKWLPLIVKFNRYFNTNFKPSKSLYVEKIDAVNIRLIEKYLLSLEFAALYGVLHAVETLKSLVLTICCLNEHISVEEAVLLSKMEEEYQCINWGRVNWIQDYSYNDSVARLSAAMIFIYYNTNHWLKFKRLN